MKKSNPYREQLFAIQNSKPLSLYEAVRSFVSIDGKNLDSLLVLAATKHYYKQIKKRGKNNAN